MPKINPEILIWARQTAGLTVHDAANKLGLGSEDRLQALETGQRDPTRRQLSNMSARYRRPLLTFYLPKPPRQAAKGQDFRSLPERELAGSEPIVDALIRDVQARQQLVRASLEEADTVRRIAFVGSAHMENGVDAVATSMQRTLGISIHEFRNRRNVTEAFAYLRRKAEQAGAFVLLIGNLGTHHTDIDVHAFRGFALADPIAPFVVINEKDSRAAWSFTLLHELAHIWLGQTGVSGYESDVEVERFCDAVAARILLNDDELHQLIAVPNPPIETLKEQIDQFSAQRKVSRKMVAYNLLRSGLITTQRYRQLVEIFDTERKTLEEEREEGEGGPNYYVVKRHRVGEGLVGVVKRMLAEGALTTTKASKVLGVKPTAVARLIEIQGAA